MTVNVVLWIAQGLLAMVFAASGALKSTMGKERLLATGQTGVAFLSQPGIRVVAAGELLAVVGLILPWWTGTAPVLTPLAAVGLAIVMIGAAISHAKLGEPRNVAINALLFGVCVFVAAGRFADLA